MSRIKNNPLDWIDKEPDKPKEESKPMGRPRTIKRDYDKSSQEGLPEQWTRATFIVREDLLKNLKDYAYTERKTIKEVVNEMIEDYLKDKDIIERNED